jgi:RNA exonuclease 1
VIDTAVLFPHPDGLPKRWSLAFLASRFLKRTIQNGSHDSYEDGLACLDLLKFKLKQKY